METTVGMEISILKAYLAPDDFANAEFILTGGKLTETTISEKKRERKIFFRKVKKIFLKVLGLIALINTIDTFNKSEILSRLINLIMKIIS